MIQSKPAVSKTHRKKEVEMKKEIEEEESLFLPEKPSVTKKRRIG